MGLRFLLVVFALLGVVLILRHFLSRRGSGTSSPPRAAITNAVRCARCQLHVPQHEALEYRGRYYCSREHLQLDQEQPPV